MKGTFTVRALGPQGAVLAAHVSASAAYEVDDEMGGDVIVIDDATGKRRCELYDSDSDGCDCDDCWPKRYKSPFRAAARIAGEVIAQGASEGWSGDAAEAAVVERILADFNIGYVDDMRGSWAKRPGGSSFFQQAWTEKQR